MDYLQLTLDYVEGRITPSEYEAMLESDDQLYQWIQSIVPDGKEIRIVNRKLFKPESFPFDIRLALKKYEALDEGGPRGTLSYHYHIHHEVAQLIGEALPDLQLSVDPKPAILRELQLFAIPDYIGGKEVCESRILTTLLADIPVEWSESKRNKAAKDRVKQAFHIEGRKRPYWIQNPEWPMSNGVPMRYEKTTRVNREFVQHHFSDIETGEVRIVDDFY